LRVTCGFTGLRTPGHPSAHQPLARERSLQRHNG
jgi:hypothetical protein